MASPEISEKIVYEVCVPFRCVPIHQIPGGDETTALQFTFYNEVARIPALINTTVATHQAIQRVFQVCEFTHPHLWHICLHYNVAVN